MNKIAIISLINLVLNISLSAQDRGFEFLRTGEIQPSGWLKTQMEQDISTGYARYLLQLTDRCHLDIYDMENADSIRIGSGGNRGAIWWDGETTGNWMDGYIRMAYLSGNQEAIKEAGEMVKKILNFQEKNGYLGAYPQKLRYESPSGANNGELWSMACLYRGLIGYFELTGDKEALEAVERAVALTISRYNKNRPYWSVALGRGGSGHNKMFTDVCAQLYRITGKQLYQDFIKFLYDSWNDVGDQTQGEADALLRNLENPDLLLQCHGAHTMEHLRVPYYMYDTGNKKYEIAYKNWIPKVEKHLSPGGACISDENIEGRLGSPDIGCEYCTMTEFLISLQTVLKETGISKYGDMIEKLAFNAAQGARMKNAMAIQYLTKDNQTEATRELGHHSSFILSPTHEQVAVCCVPNAVRFYPYYVSNMWMRTTKEEGIVAVTYGPSVLNTTVNGVKVEIIEETSYPFEENLRFIINPRGKLEFPVWLREPQWSNNTQIKATGAKIERENGYIKITKRWEEGDQVELTFGATVVRNKSFQDESYFSRGALIYSLAFEKELSKINSYPLEGFYDFEAKARQGQSLSYSGIKQSEFTFKKDENGTGPSWKNPKIMLEGQLFNDDNKMVEKVILLPYGSTLLRQTTFPDK